MQKIKQKIRHINDLDVFLLISIGWIAILSTVFEIFGVIDTHGRLTNMTFAFGEGIFLKAFTPPITLSIYNHILIACSFSLFFVGLYVMCKRTSPFIEKLFLLNQALFFLFQVIGFTVMGLYPVPAALMALLAGAALYKLGDGLL